MRVIYLRESRAGWCGSLCRGAVSGGVLVGWLLSIKKGMDHECVCVCVCVNCRVMDESCV